MFDALKFLEPRVLDMQVQYKQMKLHVQLYEGLNCPASFKRMSKAKKQRRIGSRKEELCQCSSYHCHPLANGPARGVAGLLTRSKASFPVVIFMMHTQKNSFIILISNLHGSSCCSSHTHFSGSHGDVVACTEV